MARGQGVTSEAILYGSIGAREAARIEKDYRTIFPVLDPETSGVDEGLFEGCDGWSGTHAWTARVHSLPDEWIPRYEDLIGFMPDDSMAGEIHTRWRSGELQDSLRDCRPEIWSSDPADPMIAFHFEDEEQLKVPVKAGLVAAIEALAERELEYPQDAYWMIEKHGWYLVYFDGDQEIFGIIFFNSKEQGFIPV